MKFWRRLTSAQPMFSEAAEANTALSSRAPPQQFIQRIPFRHILLSNCYDTYLTYNIKILARWTGPKCSWLNKIVFTSDK